MNCQRCGERPGEIRYTEYTDGKAEKLLICAPCAASLGFGTLPSGATGPPPKLLGVVNLKAVTGGSAGMEGEEPADLRRCPGCGLTAEQFERDSLFGCDRCYETFEDDLDLLLKRIHGAVLHRGRLPHGLTAAAGVEPAELRRDLEDALRVGDFERAARLREKIRQSAKGRERGEEAGP